MGRDWDPKKLCRHCSCNPCQCHTFEQKRAAGQAAYDERKASKPEPKKKKKTETKKKKTETKPKISKAKFVKQLRRDNPTISDAQVKKKLKAAGYKVGCGVVAIALISSPVGGVIWAGYEVVRAVWG
jgi:hypothetical protein